MNALSRTLIVIAGLACTPSVASDVTVGISVSDHRRADVAAVADQIISLVGQHNGAKFISTDAQGDVALQLTNVEQLISQGANVLIVDAADPSADLSQSAARDGVPIVYVRHAPPNLAALPANQVFVGARETDAGRLAARQVCDMLKTIPGKSSGAQILVLTGADGDAVAAERVQGIADVVGKDDCSFMKVAAQSSGKWTFDEADATVQSLLNNPSNKFDAVIASSDAMALGAIDAAKKTVGIEVGPTALIVGGVGAQADAFNSMGNHELSFTVFEDQRLEDTLAVEVALALAKGDAVSKQSLVPMGLITPDVKKDECPTPPACSSHGCDLVADTKPCCPKEGCMWTNP
jgi:ABC-type sugar transport system substrate-binding protein